MFVIWIMEVPYKFAIRFVLQILQESMKYAICLCAFRSNIIFASRSPYSFFFSFFLNFYDECNLTTQIYDWL